MKQTRLTEDNKVIATFKKLSKAEWHRTYEAIKNLPIGMRKYIASSKEWLLECNDDTYHLLHELNFHIDPNLYRKMNNVEIDMSWKKEKIPQKYDYLLKDQVEVFKFAKHFEWKALIGSDMGSGKTNTALSILDYTEHFPALIVCPTIVKYNWVKQYDKWIHAGDRIKIIETSTDLKLYNDEYDIYIVNYQLLARAMVKVKEDNGFIFMAKDSLNAFYDNYFETVIIDEIHKCKGNNSQTTNAVRFMCNAAESVLALSGTPILNSSIDVFPILNILKPEEFNNYYKFGKRFCYESDRYVGKMKRMGSFYGSRNSEELNAILSNGIMIRQDVKYIKECRGEEYFEPNVTILPIKPAKKSAYLEAEKVFGYGINKGDDKKTSFGKLSKMRLEAWNLKKKACFGFIDDLLEESGDKIVVFAHNKAVISDLKEYYSKSLVYIDGDVDTKKGIRDDIVDKFVNNNKIQLIAISIEAGNAGIDGLQFASHTMVFLQEAWNEGIKMQCYGRVSNRTGQMYKANIFHLICEGTIDEMFLALQDKKKAEITKAIDGEILEESKLMNNIFNHYKKKYKEIH